MPLDYIALHMYCMNVTGFTVLFICHCCP